MFVVVSGYDFKGLEALVIVIRLCINNVVELPGIDLNSNFHYTPI